MRATPPLHESEKWAAVSAVVPACLASFCASFCVSRSYSAASASTRVVCRRWRSSTEPPADHIRSRRRLEARLERLEQVAVAAAARFAPALPGFSPGNEPVGAAVAGDAASPTAPVGVRPPTPFSSTSSTGCVSERVFLL